MIEYINLILNNKQFIEFCNQNLNCNSFLFESDDEIYLKNFSLCFAQKLFCSSLNILPCGECLMCKKVDRLSLSDLKIYPKNNQSILVDDIKDLIESINLKPLESEKKVFILNDFSSANIQAQNKLLKILEEPPKNCYIILNVSNINKVLPTIISRCKKLRLSKLSALEIKSQVDFENLSENQINSILNLSNNNLTKVLDFIKNKKFLEVFDDVLKTLNNLKDSTQLLKYSVMFNKSKDIFLMALEIFESIFSDILMLRLNQKKLVKNNHILNNLEELSNFLTADAILKIIKKIYEIKKQLDYNCNYVYLVDNFLLYYLEVKFLCNKK